MKFYKFFIPFAVVLAAKAMAQAPTPPTPNVTAVMKSGATLTAGFTLGSGNTLSLGGGTISGSGTIDLSTATLVWPSTSQNFVFAGPTSGSGVPTWRALVTGDLPTTTSILDLIGSTRGSILERGSSGWAAITPGTSTYVLTSNGSGNDPSWTAIPTQVAGSNQQLQFNNSGVFGASSNLTWDGNNLNVLGAVRPQTVSTNGVAMRAFPSSSSYNNGNVIYDFYDHNDVSNSSYGMIGIANSSWAAPINSVFLFSSKNGSGTTKPLIFWAQDAPSSSNQAITVPANTNHVIVGNSTSDNGDNLQVIGNIYAPLTTPASSSATGVTGTIEWDANYVYICTATNTWKRATLATF